MTAKLNKSLEKELTDEINIGLGLNVTQDNVALDEDLYKFGKTAVLIRDYYSEKYDRHFSFRLQIDLIKMEIQANVKPEKQKGEGKKKEKVLADIETKPGETVEVKSDGTTEIKADAKIAPKAEVIEEVHKDIKVEAKAGAGPKETLKAEKTAPKK